MLRVVSDNQMRAYCLKDEDECGLLRNTLTYQRAYELGLVCTADVVQYFQEMYPKETVL